MTIQPEALCLYLNAMTKVDKRVPDARETCGGKRTNCGTTNALARELRSEAREDEEALCLYLQEGMSDVNFRFMKLRPGMSADDVVRVYNDTVEKLRQVIVELEKSNVELRKQVVELEVKCEATVSLAVSELNAKVSEMESDVVGLKDRMDFHHGSGGGIL